MVSVRFDGCTEEPIELRAAGIDSIIIFLVESLNFLDFNPRLCEVLPRPSRPTSEDR